MNTPTRTRHDDATTPAWYVATGRATEKRQGTGNNTLAETVEKYNHSNNTRIRLFAPTIVVLSGENTCPRRTQRPLMGNYVFLRCTLAELKDFRNHYPQLNPVIDHASSQPGRYLTVADHDMERFQALATMLCHRVPCYSPGEIDLEKGDYVGIVGGPFQGLEGILISQQGSDGGRVAVNIANQLLAVTYQIEPRYIKVLRFAKGNKHVYDRLDAFAKRLDKAIAEHTATGTLSLSSTAALGYFIDRFGTAEIPGPKTRCRFKAHLMAAAHLLGDTTRSQEAMADTLTLLPSVTNPATAAAIHRLLALCNPA